MKVDWTGLRKMTKEQLIELGLRPFDSRLMVFPHSWYEDIPAGFEVEAIDGKIFAFEPGVTDDDQRFGCLAFGIPLPDDLEVLAGALDLPTAVELASLPKRRGLDRIFDALDDALHAGKEAEIDAWLDRTDPDTLSTQNITGVLTLTVTPPFRGKLTRRDAWYGKAEQALRGRAADSYRIDRLIGNLR